MKRSICTFAIAIGLGTFAPAQQVFQMPKTFQDGSFWFSRLSDSTVEMVQCQENCAPLTGAVTVPATVSDGYQEYTVTRLGERLFTGVYGGVGSVSLPPTLEEIGSNCFNGSGITSLTLPASLKRIDKGAFAFSRFTSLHIPAPVESIGASAFYGSQVATITVDSANTRYRMVEGLLYTSDTTVLLAAPKGFHGTDGTLVLPPTVRRIEADAMSQVSSSLMGLVLPEGLRELGECALAGYMWSVELPSTVCRLEGNPTLGRLSAPFELTVHPSNTHYRMEDGQLMSMDGDTLFLVMLPLGTYTYSVPAGTRVLAAELFCGWTQLNSVNLPEGLEVIQDGVFDQVNCSVNLPSSLRAIGSRAFRMNSRVADLVLPSGIREIGELAFSESSVRSVVLPDSLKVIGAQAFNHCSQLQSVVWNRQLEEVHSEALRYTPRLRELPPLPRSLRTVGYRAMPIWVNYLQFEGAPDTLGEYAVSSVKVRFGEGNPPFLYPNALFQADTVVVPCGMEATYRSVFYWGDRYTFVEDCDGIGDNLPSDIRVYPLGGRIVVEGADGEEVRVYDMMGRELNIQHLTLNTGIYLVRVGDRPARKVAIVR